MTRKTSFKGSEKTVTLKALLKMHIFRALEVNETAKINIAFLFRPKFYDLFLRAQNLKINNLLLYKKNTTKSDGNSLILIFSFSRRL